ncbi:monooxygenase [Thermoascus aurantiacus ATCC 26904]
MIYRHWKTNRIINEEHFVDVPLRRHQTARFHRGHLHSALLQHVPPELIHLNKRVTGAKVSADKVTLYFADGTSAEGDVLVGADGIHSKVRAAFVPNHKLKWTGKVFARSTFDASLVEGIKDLPADSTHWWGPNENFFASRLGQNQYTTVGNFDVDPTTPEGSLPAWNSEGDVGYLRQRYRDWNPVVRALIDATPYTRLYPNWAGEPLSTWVFGSRATLVGDAAHTHGGAFAAGGSLAIDDAYALYLAFRHVFLSTKLTDASVGRIEKALALYDRIRRPHTERLLKIVLNNNSNNKTIGKDDIVNAEDVLVQRIKNKPDTTWLSEHDVEKAFQNVIRDDDASIKGRHAAEVRGGSRL